MVQDGELDAGEVDHQRPIGGGRQGFAGRIQEDVQIGVQRRARGEARRPRRAGLQRANRPGISCPQHVQRPGRSVFASSTTTVQRPSRPSECMIEYRFPPPCRRAARPIVPLAPRSLAHSSDGHRASSAAGRAVADTHWAPGHTAVLSGFPTRGGQRLSVAAR